MKRYNRRGHKSQSEMAGRGKKTLEVGTSFPKRGPNSEATPVSRACPNEKSKEAEKEEQTVPTSPSLSCSSIEETVFEEPRSLNGSLEQDAASVNSEAGSASSSGNKKEKQRGKQRRVDYQKKNNTPSAAPKKRRMPGRAAVAAKYIAMSMSEEKSREQGVLDAQKEMARLNQDEERDTFFETLLSIKDLHVQNLGYILASWFWQARIMTTSYAVLGVLAQLRSLGLQYELSEEPEVVIGDPSDYQPLFLIVGTGIGSMRNIPYYDQWMGSEILDRYDYLVHRDHHHELLCHQNRIDNWPVHRVAQRFSGRTVDSGRLHDILFREEETKKVLHQDLLVRSLLRASRCFSESVFSVAMQYIGDNANLPTYWVWRADFAVETVMAVLEENHELFRTRLQFSNRSAHWDEKYLDSFSGFTIAGRSFATETIINFFDQVVVPKARALKKKMKESVHDVQRDFHRRFDPPDDEGPEPDRLDPAESGEIVISSEPYVPYEPSKAEQKLEEIAEKVDDTIVQLNESFQELEPFEPETGALEVEHLVQLMCFHGAYETASELARRGLCEAAVDLLEKMPYVPCHSLVSAYNHLADRYFYFPRFIAFQRYMEIYERLAPYGAQDNCMSLYVTTNQFPSPRDPIHLPVSYFDHHIENPRCAIGICFTQAELGFYNEKTGDCIPWRDHFANAVVTKAPERIESEQLFSPEAGGLFQHGFISEVYYVNYFRTGLCFTKACLPSALISRLARPVPNVDRKAADSLCQFRRKATWPKIMWEEESGIVDLETFSSYLVNMPSASRRKHLEHFIRRFSIVGVLTMPTSDSAFPKYDEILPSCKPRLIINPPSELFYQLVQVCTMLKKALKRKTIFKVFENDDHVIYFTYGADMTVRQKSDWFGKACAKAADSRNKIVACFIVGGDDNACVMGINEVVFAWESDVTACDQSHNEVLVDNFVNTCRDMGAPESSCQILKDSYMRPIRINDVKIRFLKPQLHTGHPQTSFANTITVGEVCMCIVAEMKYSSLSRIVKEEDFFSAFAETVTLRAQRYGMIFKVQAHKRPLDVTFHKGHWVPANHPTLKRGHVWMPLPSCLWKATKIRTDSHISRKELLIRMAFNLYQRLIYPNHRIVREYCLKLFRTILSLLDLSDEVSDHRFGAYVEAHFHKYFERASLNKAGEISELDPFMGLDEAPFWDEASASEFLARRYKLCESDLFPGDGTFRGVRCAGWQAVICRDYGSDTLSDSLNHLFGYSSVSVSSRES